MDWKPTRIVTATRLHRFSPRHYPYAFRKASTNENGLECASTLKREWNCLRPRSGTLQNTASYIQSPPKAQARRVQVRMQRHWNCSENHVVRRNSATFFRDCISSFSSAALMDTWSVIHLMHRDQVGGFIPIGGSKLRKAGSYPDVDLTLSENARERHREPRNEKLPASWLIPWRRME